MIAYKELNIGVAAIAVAFSLAWPSTASAQVVDPQPAGSGQAVDPEPAASTDDATSTFGDIVVTAQKREQRIQDVGIAITAISGQQLRTLNVVDSRDIAGLTPGVHISGNLAGQNVQYTIRGVTQSDFADISEAPNAVYLDEGYIALGQGQTFALFDIDRVEVLKGPQGTLFGRNATGGLVHYVTTKPTLDAVKGYAEVRGGIFDSSGNPGLFHGEAAINIPLTDTLAIRGGGFWNKQGALLRNHYPANAVGGSPGPGAGANMGDDDTIAGRLTALFEPSDSASFTLSVNAAHSRMSTAPYQQKATIAVFDTSGELVDVVDAGPNETRASIAADGSDNGSDPGNTGTFGAPFGRPVPGGDLFGYVAPKGWDTSSDFAFKDQNHINTFGANLTGAFDLSNDVSLTSVTDYKHFEKLLFIDVDGGPANQAANYAGLDAYSLAQELRLNGKADNLTWAAGLYYLHIDVDNIFGLKFPVGSIVPGAPFDLGTSAKLVTNSYSAFGQVDWSFAPRLTLVVGGRIIREEKKYNFFQGIWPTQSSLQAQVGTPVIIGPSAGGIPYADSRGETLWAGKLQLEFRPVDHLLVYAGINRGVKAGSYNAPLAGGLPITDNFLPYKAETLYNYEGGFKYSFPDGRTRLNASAYYYDYKNYQSFLFTGVSGVVINAPQQTYGFEGEFFTSPIDGLDTGLTVSWSHATVNDVPLRLNGPYTRDVRPTYAPRLQASAILRYSWDGLGGRMSIGGDAAYTSKFYYNLRNFTADQYGRRVMVNASLNYNIEPWSFTLAVKNLTNVRQGVIGFDLAGLCGCNETSYKPPRLFTLSARVEF